MLILVFDYGEKGVGVQIDSILLQDYPRLAWTGYYQ